MSNKMVPLDIITAVCLVSCVSTMEYREIQSTALEALYLVEHLTLNGCSPNTVAEIEHLQLNYSVLEESTRRAVLGSNLLTSIILERNGSLDSLSEDFLYNFVRNNIVGQTATYSSFVVLEPEVYPKHQSFAPMATTKSGTIETLDVSLSYDYRTSDSYTVLKTKNWDNITETKTKKQIWMQRKRSLIYEDKMLFTTTSSDGYWTKPYYDCGFSNVLMVTYSSPVFGRNSISGKPEFKGVVVADVDISHIDVNQCDMDDDDDNTEDVFLNVFRGTHKCPNYTRCKFTSGKGFKSGSYQCICEEGYYFPDVNVTSTAFDGKEIENASDLKDYKCLPCRERCITCKDYNTCLETSSNGTQSKITISLLIIVLSARMIIISQLILI